MDCASLLADNLYYLFFYRATPAMKKTEGLRIRRSRARLTYYRVPARDEEGRRPSRWHDCYGNGFYISFIIQIMRFVSYYVASIYLGASGIKFGDFILGSMCGTSLNIFIDGLFGKYLFNPLSWQLWAVVVIRGAVIALTIIIRIRIRKNE